MLSLLVGYIFILLSGCAQNTIQKHYYVLVVEGEEDLIKEFDKYASVKNPVIEIDYYKNMKDAKKKFPSYSIEDSPVVFIFSISKEKDKNLELRTNDNDKSLRMLKSIKNDKS